MTFRCLLLAGLGLTLAAAELTVPLRHDRPREALAQVAQRSDALTASFVAPALRGQPWIGVNGEPSGGIDGVLAQIAGLYQASLVFSDGRAWMYRPTGAKTAATGGAALVEAARNADPDLVAAALAGDSATISALVRGLAGDSLATPADQPGPWLSLLSDLAQASGAAHVALGMALAKAPELATKAGKTLARANLRADPWLLTAAVALGLDEAREALLAIAKQPNDIALAEPMREHWSTPHWRIRDAALACLARAFPAVLRSHCLDVFARFEKDPKNKDLAKQSSQLRGWFIRAAELPGDRERIETWLTQRRVIRDRGGTKSIDRGGLDFVVTGWKRLDPAKAAATLAQTFAVEHIGRDHRGTAHAMNLVEGLHGEAADALLVELTRHDDAFIRGAAVTELARRQHPQALDRAVAVATADPEPATQEAAIKAIAQVRTQAALDALTTILTERTGKNERKAALEALAASRDDRAYAQVVAMLGHEDAEARMLAANALVAARYEPALAALIGLLEHDPSTEVRAIAAVAIASIPSPSGVEALIRRLDGEQSAAARRIMVSALIPRDRAMAELLREPLVAYLDQEQDPEVRAALVKTLAGVGGELASGSDNRRALADRLLAQLRNDKDSAVRMECLRYLGYVDDERRLGEALAALAAGESDTVLKGRIERALRQHYGLP